MKELKARLAKNLLILRAIRGFSQEELADKSGVAIQVIRRIESATTWAEAASIEALTGALGITPLDFFSKDFDATKKGTTKRSEILKLIKLLSTLDEDTVSGFIKSIQRVHLSNKAKR